MEKTTDRVKTRTNYSRKRKRRYQGNQFINNNKKTSISPAINSTEFSNPGAPNNTEKGLNISASSIDTSVSHSKVEHFEAATPKQHEIITGFRFLDMEILAGIIEVVCCPVCKRNDVRLCEQLSRKQGICSLLQIKCGYCKIDIKEVFTSKQNEKSFEINQRIIYTMRVLGQGYSGIKKFTNLMNMPTPMTNNNYDKQVKTISKIVKEVADESMSDAADALKCGSNEIVDTDVSCDGSWQRRGYASLNGVVTAISITNGKILDCEPMSRFCKGCSMKEPLKNSNPMECKKWKATHQCKTNYTGSAPGMEVTGAKRMFSHSIEKHGL